MAAIVQPTCFVNHLKVDYQHEQDWSKLDRLLAYINSTRDIPLCLEMDKAYPVRISASIDSSHATHGDYRGHTGVYITLEYFT